ncbi:unnamed protein product [Scytosiphon promiscuus]
MDAPANLTIEGRAQPPSPPLAAGEGLVDGRDGNADRDKFDQPVTAATATTAPTSAAESNPDDPDHDAKVVAFERWLLENGGNFPRLEIRRYDPEVRGVHARGEIDPDEVIVEIPLKCLVTVEMGKGLPVGQAVLASGVSFDAPKHIFLMLFILTDMKRQDTFFRPYYDLLPTTLSNMPIFWSEEEMRLLKGSYLVTQVEERNQAIEGDYGVICDLYPPFRDVATLEEFKWARMCVCSRNFGLDIGGLRTSALVPYADMLNHYRPRETKWTYDNERGAFTITTLHRIMGGAQVYDSYGQKCNHRFLLNYGFAIENNQEANGFCPNEVPLLFRLDARDPLRQKKARFWRMDGPEQRRVRLCVGDTDAVQGALSMLRIIVANAAEMVGIEEGARYMYRTVKDVRFPLSVRNEAAAMERLLVLASGALDAYPTTLEEDKAALKNGGLEPFSNRRHALIQVCGEKVVLRHYVELAETALACLTAVDSAELISRCREKSKLIRDHCSVAVKNIYEQDKARGLIAPSRAWGGQMTADPTIV